MDKIIIIGNGFDLAHGIKTSYKHFIHDYIKTVYLGSIAPHRYSDDLLESRISYHQNASLFRQGKEFDFLNYYFSRPEDIIIKSDFLKSLLKINKDHNWVDIENAFFNHLFKNINLDTKRVNIEKIILLNNELDLIKQKLIDYLKSETTKYENVLVKQYINSFIDGIRRNPSDRITFINFNYTNTLNEYINGCKNFLNYKFKNIKIDERIDQINIHGSIDINNEKPIFGIGDEHHELYKAIKDFDEIQTILKNSKSFWYQRNNNYIKIVDTLNRSRDGFTVQIFGHSCGLSDRTLLKSIFEHNNVKKIELFQYGGLDGYVRQSYDVWRHFDDSHVYRSKLIAFNPENEMPQVEDNAV